MRLLYVCPDLGIPVLGRKGASIHVRELVAAFTRQGAEVLVGAATLEGSPWEEPAALAVPVLHVRASPETTAAVSGVRAMRDALGASTELPGDLRRILRDPALGEACCRGCAGRRLTRSTSGRRRSRPRPPASRGRWACRESWS